MTPANRKDYFEKIRKHAQELQLLLQQTRFCNDYGDDERELTEKELNKKLSERLYDWADDEADEGHIVAFRVTIDGVFEQHYTYPDNALFSTLSGLVEWTYWDDNWDGNIFKSSLPIAQANSASAAIVFFTCSLHDYFSKDGIEIPFAILATVANVALKLDFDSQVDEDAVRKQVRRYQQRTAKDKKPGRLNAFDDTGQNCWDSDNSVLSEPF